MGIRESDGQDWKRILYVDRAFKWDVFPDAYKVRPVGDVNVYMTYSSMQGSLLARIRAFEGLFVHADSVDSGILSHFADVSSFDVPIVVYTGHDSDYHDGLFLGRNLRVRHQNPRFSTPEKIHQAVAVLEEIMREVAV